MAPAGNLASTNLRASRVTKANPAYQAYQILHYAFVAAPLVAGLDKFFGLLVDWNKYLAPLLTGFTGVRAPQFMALVGFVEVALAIGVAFKPRVFAYLLAAWLAGIILNLMLMPAYYDLALRDFGLLLGAVALGRLSDHFDHAKTNSLSMHEPL